MHPSGDEPWCEKHDMHYGDCECVGPHSEGYDFKTVRGVMYARKRE